MADSQTSNRGIVQTEKSRKRPAPPSDAENEDDMVDSMLPAAAAMKRRRMEEEQAQMRGTSVESSLEKSQPKLKPTQKETKPRKEVDIKEVVRERREAEEQAAQRDEESLRETLDGMNVEEMKNLAVVEEMEVPEHSRRSLRESGNGSFNDRWDERWNGRKNFKKFRRRGDGEPPRRGQTVIVPLEEVKKKDFGIGEEYWLESEKSKKRKGKERESQSQNTPFTPARSQPVEAPPELTNGEEPEVIDVDAPRTTRLMDQANRDGRIDAPSEVRKGKRPATARGRTQPAKKQRLLSTVESDSDSEDELRFRFKKRR